MREEFIGKVLKDFTEGNILKTPPPVPLSTLRGVHPEGELKGER